MSFPTKSQRQQCWDSRDRYWQCLDTSKSASEECAQLRKLYESSCPAQWVKHFDRKKSYLQFKERIEKDGFHNPSLNATNKEVTTSKKRQRKYRNPMIIGCCQKLNSTPNALLPPSLTEIANILLEILSKCKLSFENQILASIAFCLTMNLIQEPLNISLMFCKVFIPATTDPFQIKLSKGSELRITVSQPDLFKICLCNGLLQLNDSFWSSEHLNWNDLMYSKMFPVLEDHCFRYTQLTLLSFKCLFYWLRKVNSCTAVKSTRRIAQDLSMRILNIVMANWENPMNGVKEQNSMIFEQLLSATETFQDDEGHGYLKSSALLNLVLTEQSWMMKSKYFLLSVILPKCGIMKSLSRYPNDIVTGLLNSLAYTHLASAGTELYRVCLEPLSVEQWQQIFLQPITNILIASKYMLQKQNIFNYWIPYTIKKYKVALELLYDALISYESETCIIFPIICILKLGRKEGYESMQWQQLSQSNYLSRALKHSDEMVRSHAFATLCVSSKGSVSPTDQEFQMVENFLAENINADHAALRQNILSSLTAFLCRVRDACLHALKTKYHGEPGHFDNRSLTRSMIFLEWLYNFLKSNLEVGSNYQRMYTSLEIYKMVLNHFSNDTGQGGTGTTHRKGSLKSEGYKVMKYAIAVGKWSFTSEHSREILLYCISNPAEDIRESAGFILMTYFKFNDNETNRFGELHKKAVQLCSDMMFYYAESGALLVQVVTSLAYKNGGVAGLKPLDLATKDDRVSSTLLSITAAQSVELKADLLKAASQGSPLHGILFALSRLSTDRTSPEFASLTQSERLKLITIMETTVEHLLQVLSSRSTNISEYAPSFCEMGEAIESTVEGSAVSIEESDKLQLSPAYQLVLNCIWLNLRVCCSFSSGLVLSCGGMSDSEVERCWRIVINVLKHCRHKGALEVAGNSMASITKHITSTMPYGTLATMLETQVLLPAISQLIDVIGECGDSCMTQSMRGAGNVVFLHRLIASDARPNKPFLHISMSQLMEVMSCENRDLPQIMHLFSMLIQDSGLGQDMARYIHPILLNCLNTLNYKKWPVRNASLQLFGAIVPKLIGQRKRQEDDSGCTCYHLAYEELLYHAKPLVTVLLEQLEEAASTDAVTEHSKLVPVLTLLSNLSVGLLTIIDRSLGSVFHKFINTTQKLMSSKLHDARHLAAKANAWFCSSSQLASLIKTRVWKIVTFINDRTVENEIKTQNDLHGFLLNTKFLYSRFLEEKEGISALKDQVDDVRQSIVELMGVKDAVGISYVCRTILSELTGHDDTVPATKQIEDIIVEIVKSRENPHRAIGIFQWAGTRIEKIIEHCSLNELIQVLSLCLLNSEYYELHRACFKGLRNFRIQRPEFESVANGVLNVLFQYINDTACGSDCNEALEVALEIVCRYSLNGLNVNAENAIRSLSEPAGQKSMQLSSACIPVMCAILAVRREEVDYRTIMEVVSRLFDYCNPGKYDEECRMNAAKGLVVLGPLVASLDLDELCEVKAVLWESAVTVLQDEHSRVRLEAGKFVRHLAVSCSDVWNPYVALQYLFHEATLKKLFTTEYILKCLWRKLKCSISELGCLDYILDESIVNPYETGVANIYEENVKVIDVATKSLLILIANEEIGKTLLKEEVVPHLRELRDQCLKFLTFSSDHVLTDNIMLNSDWYVVSKKLGNQCKVINAINNTGLEKDLEMFQYRFQSFIEQLEFNK